MVVTDLLKIRALNGSQHYAFEELCCQLASLEPKQLGTSFIRKGSGADAGVECFLLHADNTETGWQAKFFDCFKSVQASQLTESFTHAIEKHPRLTRYIVCLPIDLKDGRTGKEKSEGQRWRDWKSSRLKEVTKLGRLMEIELWQATNIRERLYRQDPYYSGRMQFFFDEQHFSTDWFNRKFCIARDALGARYSPQFHVSLPIRQSFLGIMRDAVLDDQRAELAQQLRKRLSSLRSSLTSIPLTQTTLDSLYGTGQQLIESFDKHFSVADDIPLSEWNLLIDDLNEATRECFGLLWPLDTDEHDKSTRDASRSARNVLYEFEKCVDNLHEAIHSKTWRLANEQAVLVFGDAGVGKSHLLADIAADTIKNGCPAILLINSQFFLHDPRSQILEHLDLRGLTFDTFLGALDSAGQAVGQRAVILIDALNERYGIELWREYLATLVGEVKRFPFVSLIVSCRSTYLNALFPDDSSFNESLPRLEHHGFSDGGGRAARAYLAQRKIIRPSVPNLLPEFNNPLFLKTCCDSLDRQGLKEFPRGVQGVSHHFNFYLQSLIKVIETRMKLDKYQKIVQRALDGLTQSMLAACSSYIPLDDAISCLEAVLPSLGQQDRSLVSELEHEGVITIEPVYIGANQLEEQVRFTFERFSDFQIATYLLQNHLQSGQSLRPLETSSPLKLFFEREDIYRYAGIFDALAIILPEQADVEFPELFSAEECNWVIEEAFLNSLLLRRQDKFSAKTKDLVVLFSTHQNHWLNALIAVTTEPGNPFNGYYLHGELTSCAMPERDALWSVPIAELELDEGSPLDILLSWALESGFDEIEPVRVELAAIALTWLFSTSHRTIRDRATKSLSALLAPRLTLACTLLERFRLVDDLYVIERMLAAIYGATLQAKTHEGLAPLATAVYEYQFAGGKPAPHVLLRDYARGIIEYANYRGVLPDDISMELVRPPYRSVWPIEYVAEVELKEYTKRRNAYRDEIVQSAGSEWTGDFAKYIIAPSVSHWTATSLGKSVALTPFESFQKFTDHVSAIGTDAQKNVLSDLFEFCRGCLAEDQQDNDDCESLNLSAPIKIRFVPKGDDYWQRSRQNEEKFKELENSFLDILDSDLRYRYQTSSRHFLQGLTNGYTRDLPDTFDVILAQRWVCKRAHEFGWSNELHGEFDKRIGTGRSRSNKHIERVGKKYQWLALYELLARMADNLIFRSSFGDEAEVYNGPWQIGKRNIDPTLLVKRTQDDGWQKHPSVWWSPQALRLKTLNRKEQLLWLETDVEQLNSSTLLDVTEPISQQRWLVLQGFKHYTASNDTGLNIDSWCRIWCVVLPKRQKTKFVNAIAEHTLIDSHALPSAVYLDNAFVGEYPWHPACSIEDDWKTINHDYGYRGKILPTVSEFEKGTGGYDHSLEQNLSFYLPAPWLMRGLGMQLVDGRELCFASSSGLTLFKDPSIHESGPSAALVNKAAFLEILEREGFTPIWIIAGEKGGYGEHHDDFVGRRVHSFVYELDGTNRVVCTRQNVVHERRG